MLKLRFFLAAAALFCALPHSAKAVFTFTLTQTAGNVVITGSGTINTAGLPSGTTQTPSGADIFIVPQSAEFFNDPTGGAVTIFTGISGPGSFGSGSFTSTPLSNASGSAVGINFANNGTLALPVNYVSGSPLADTATFTSRTFSSLGFTPGTYTFTFGSGANADSLIVTSVVPEPSTQALAAVGVAGLGVVTLRRRAVRLA